MRTSLVSAVSLTLLAIAAMSQVATLPSQQKSTLSPAEIDVLQARAKGNDPTAQLALGAAYEDGNGVSQNDKLAMKWYQAAAEQGNATAQNSLGLMFRTGRGVEQDKVEAIKWFRKAAKQLNATAMFNLGSAYYNGDGVGIDDEAAYAWFLLAQTSGSRYADDAVKRMTDEKPNLQSGAFERIGDMYQKGADPPRSSDQAFRWYRMAAVNGPPSTQFKLPMLLLEGQNEPSDYTEVRSLCEKAAKVHFGPGAACMGELYRLGHGVEANPSKAAKWFTEAASMGNALGTMRLGQMYWKGEGAKRDRLTGYGYIYLASFSTLTEADMAEVKRDKETMERELSPQEVQRAKNNAVEWARRHSPLVLHKASNAN